MSKSPFPPELRTLAFVPRWSVVITTIKDNVATHSFYVAVYGYMIAETIGWKGPRDYLMLDCLLHDNDESITGDITGTFKDQILDAEVAGDLLFDKTAERMEGLIDAYYDLQERHPPNIIEQAEKIRLVADKLDAVLFLILNKRMGNTMMQPALDGGLKSLEAAWRALPAEKEVLDRAWQTVVLPSIAAHHVKGGRGVHPSIPI